MYIESIIGTNVTISGITYVYVDENEEELEFETDYTLDIEEAKMLFDKGYTGFYCDTEIDGKEFSIYVDITLEELEDEDVAKLGIFIAENE